MTSDEYNWCLTVFFFTYAAFEVPSNLLLKKLRPSIWLPTIMVAWGTVMTLMGIVKNYEGLLIARIFLGVTEAGLFPGVAVRLHPSQSQVLTRTQLIGDVLVLPNDVVLPPRDSAATGHVLLGSLYRRRFQRLIGFRNLQNGRHRRA